MPIAGALGYTSPTNGSSKAVMAALKYYGLLEPSGDGLLVSEDAIRVFELPKGDPDRTRALRRMVLAPPVFAELRSKFSGELPHLLISQGYGPKAADEIIRVYGGNFEFLAGQGGEAHAEATSEVDEVRRTVSPADNRETESTNGSRGYPDVIDRVLQFQISKGSDARIHLRGRPNRLAIRKLSLC
jgi:hypothetical protein